MYNHEKSICFQITQGISKVLELTGAGRHGEAITFSVHFLERVRRAVEHLENNETEHLTQLIQELKNLSEQNS